MSSASEDGCGCISLVALIVIIVSIGLCTDCSSGPEKPKPAPDVTINGHDYTSFLVVDKKQGKSWRAVCYDRCFVIIPGSEQPLPVEKP